MNFPIKKRERSAVASTVPSGSGPGERQRKLQQKIFFNQEKRKSGNWDVTRSTQGHESGLGPLSTRIKRMERIWSQNLASLRVFRGQRKFCNRCGSPASHQGHEGRRGDKPCFADAFFLGNFSPAFLRTVAATDSYGFSRISESGKEKCGNGARKSL